ncbi:MAG TPA: type 2 lanthipeptide synthetase LanM family protein [Ktedonobacteraceae bacterium]|jgi:type 2 lantibiotic biosynthesis protein LanM
MPLSDHDLRVMAAAASTLAERLQWSAPLKTEPVRDTRSAETLQAWCQSAARGDWPQFQRRLGRDGLDLQQAQQLLALPWPEQTALPAWTTTIQQVLHCIETGTGEGSGTEQPAWPLLDADRPLPFAELLAPFVALAQQRLLTESAAAREQLASTAHLALQRALLQVLISLALPTFSAELSRTRVAAEQTDEYRHFLAQMSQGGLATLYLRYSVLARLLALTSERWVETIVELLERLAADRPALRALCNADADLGQVSEIEPALSDAHGGRRTVMALTFACGSRLIYKPRSLGMEEAYYQLLHWCNARGATPPLHIVSVLNRGTYGWMQYVAQQACPDEQALQRYYERAGMLLCLIYVLGGAACFYDQFVAYNEHPILVDATHLLHPSLRPTPEPQQGEDWEQALYSVLHSGLLPAWRLPRAGPASEVSGFDLSQAYSRSPQPAHVPSALRLKYGSLRPRHRQHIALLASEAEPPDATTLQHACARGFERMYRLLLPERATLLSINGPLQAFKTQSARVAYRDHAVYETLLPQLLQPRALQDAPARSLLLEPLGRTCVPVEWYQATRHDPAHWWTVAAAEQEALLLGEIPVLWAPVARNALLLPNRQELAGCLCQPAFDLLRTRLQRLSHKDLRHQLALIQQTRPLERVSRASLPEHPGQTRFLALACALADEIVHAAIPLAPEGLTWVSAAFASRHGYYQLRPLRYGLADGSAGIAFFLAALARETGISSYGRVAVAALRPVTRLLDEDGERLAREMGLGAGPGLGSLIYALTRISSFLDEPDLLAAARTAAGLITPGRIAATPFPDVFVGIAGALLGLLTLYATAPTREVLERAQACGEELLRMRTPGQGWLTVDGVQTSGFAHGVAGIVYALARLSAHSAQPALLEAVHQGLLSEDLALDQQSGNWAETVESAPSTAGVSWCHGAPGIGLARLGTLATLKTAPVWRDLAIALQTTQRLGACGLDHLCCGTCGRAELLLTAAQRLQRPQLLTQATHWVEQILARAAQRGRYLLDPSLPPWTVHPALFQGTAGIGYTLLRLAHPARLPALLLWE